MKSNKLLLLLALIQPFGLVAGSDTQGRVTVEMKEHLASTNFFYTLPDECKAISSEIALKGVVPVDIAITNNSAKSYRLNVDSMGIKKIINYDGMPLPPRFADPNREDEVVKTFGVVIGIELGAIGVGYSFVGLFHPRLRIAACYCLAGSLTLLAGTIKFLMNIEKRVRDKRIDYIKKVCLDKEGVVIAPGQKIATTVFVDLRSCEVPHFPVWLVNEHDKNDILTLNLSCARG